MPLVCPPVADAGKVWRERVSVRGAVDGGSPAWPQPVFKVMLLPPPRK